MSDNKKQSFIQGAFILVAASLIVKLIGAFFKIPLAHLIDDEGMGIFNAAYSIYTVMFIVATAGFPTAISKMVAESLALGKKKEADRIFKVSMVVLAVIGIFGSLFLFFGADILASAIASKSAAMAIRAIAPAVLCVSFMAVIRGFFQGRSNMYPTAISEVAEAMGKLVFGYLFAWLFISHSVEKSSAGAVFGVTMGTFLGLLTLLVALVLYRKKGDAYLPAQNTGSYFSIGKRLVAIAVPITIGASVSSLTNLADMFTVMRRLQDITVVTPDFLAKYHTIIEKLDDFNGVALSSDLATSLYGLYTGKAITLFNFPLAMVVALGMSVVPVIAGALAKKDERGSKNAVNTVIKLTVLFAVPCAIGMYVLAGPILSVVFHDDLAAALLQKLAISIVFVSLLQITTSILQAYGKTVVPVVNMFIGGVIKVIINYNLVAIPSVNIDGAPIGTMVCYFTVMVLNMFWIIKETKCRFGITEYILKPCVSGGVMGVITYYVYGITSSLGTLAGMGLSIIVAVFVYFAMLVVVRAFNEYDIRMLPKGEKILGIMKKFHLI